jgi:FtsH-binding integral membrane protein
MHIPDFFPHFPILMAGKQQHAFILKVYGLLLVQLSTISLSVALSFWSPAVRRVLFANALELVVLDFLIGFASIIGIHAATTTKWKSFWFCVFTLLECVTMSFICSCYLESDMGHLVAQAAAITTGVFIVMTSIGFTFGHRLKPHEPLMYTTLWVLCVWSFLSIFFGNIFEMVYLVVASVVFCAYIAYDTHQLTEKHAAKNAYFEATLGLYLDVVNLFLIILRFLRKKKVKKAAVEA